MKSTIWKRPEPRVAGRYRLLRPLSGEDDDASWWLAMDDGTGEPLHVRTAPLAALGAGAEEHGRREAQAHIPDMRRLLAEGSW